MVDNGEGGEEIADAGAREGVSVVSPGENLGFAAGSNRGAREAAGDVLVFLNPDTVVAPGALDSLRRTLEDRSIGIAMARLLLLARPELLNSRGTEVHVSGIGWAAGYGEPAESVQEPREIAAPSGAAMAIRAETFRSLGGFAEELFMYLEDVELGWRAHLAGLRVVVDPEADVFHEYDFGRNPRKNYFIERNRLFFCLTAFSPRLLALLSPVLVSTELGMAAVALREGWFKDKAAGWAWCIRNGPVIARRRRATPAAAQGPRPRARRPPDTRLRSGDASRAAPAARRKPGRRSVLAPRQARALTTISVTSLPGCDRRRARRKVAGTRTP